MNIHDYGLWILVFDYSDLECKPCSMYKIASVGAKNISVNPAEGFTLIVKNGIAVGGQGQPTWSAIKKYRVSVTEKPWGLK